MSCIKIRYKNIPNIPTSFLDSDGYAYFDTEQNMDISHYKILTELTDLNEMPFDYTLPTDLKATPKNNYLLVEYLHGKTTYSEVEIFNGSFWVPFLLRVLEANSVSINCEFINYSLHWARRLRDSYVKDLPLGTIERNDWRKGLGGLAPAAPYPFDFTNTESDPCAFPLVDYGDLRSVTDEYLERYVEFLHREGDDKDNIRDCRFAVSSETSFMIKRPYPLNEVDFRPWHNAYNILRRMFASIGYQLVSPILESPTGRKIITYILDDSLSKEFLEPPRVTTLLDAVADQGSPYNEDLRINWYDWDTPSEALRALNINPRSKTAQMSVELLQFAQIGVFDIEIEVTWITRRYRQRSTGAAMIFAGVYEGSELVQYLGEEHYLDIEDSELLVTKLDFSNVAIKHRQRVAVSVAMHGRTTVSIFNEFNTTASPGFACPTDRDIHRTQLKATQVHRWFYYPNNGSINANSIIQRDLTNLDYLKGIAHLLGLKFQTDHAKKVVYAAQADKVDFFNTTVDGFFTLPDTIEPIKPSYKVKNQSSIVKSIKLAFNNGDIHSSRLDLHTEGEDISIENELFEATLFQEYFDSRDTLGEGKLYNPSYTQTNNKYILPNLAGELAEAEEVDAIIPTPKGFFDSIFVNIEGFDSGFGFTKDHPMYKQRLTGRREIVFDQSPRVLLHYGSRKQYSTNQLNIGVIGTTSYEFRKISVHNVAGHYHPALSNLINPPDDHPLTVGDYDKAEETLYFRFDQKFFDDSGYEGAFVGDELNLTHLQYNFLVNKYSQPTLNYQVWDTPSDFFGRTLREIYPIQHLGKPYSVITASIEDFKSCRKIPTLYNFLLYARNRWPYCVNLITDPRVVSDRCYINNNPTVGLNYEISDDLIYLSLTGLNRSPINTTTFEYSLDGELWIAIPATTPITATTPNQGVPMYFRAKVDYEGCPLRLSSSVLFDACSNNGVTIIEAIREVKPDGSVCATANIIIPSTITYELLSFTVDIGDGPIPYTDGTEICDIENAIFEIEVAIGTCPPIKQVIDVNGSQECPTADDLGLECVDGFTFNRTGILPLDVIEDYIYYQITEDPDVWPYLWQKWDEVQTITALHIRARRVIRFCGECEDICTPIIYCERDCGEYTISCTECTLSVDATEPCEVTWSGPEGFTATGFSTPVDIEGDYTATIYCSDTLCTTVLTYYYEHAEAGTGINGDGEIIIDDL